MTSFHKLRSHLVMILVILFISFNYDNIQAQHSKNYGTIFLFFKNYDSNIVKKGNSSNEITRISLGVGFATSNYFLFSIGLNEQFSKNFSLEGGMDIYNVSQGVGGGESPIAFNLISAYDFEIGNNKLHNSVGGGVTFFLKDKVFAPILSLKADYYITNKLAFGGQIKYPIIISDHSDIGTNPILFINLTVKLN